MKQTVCIDSTFDEITDAVSALEMFLAETPLDEMQKIQVSLAVTEVLNNIVEHGYQNTSGGTVTLTFFTTETAVQVEFTDEAPAYDGMQMVDAEIPDPLTMPESGWGMGIVNQSVDDIQYQRRGKYNHITLVKHWA